MSANALQALADPFRAASLRVRWSLISFVAFVVAGALGFASLVILGKAKTDREAIEERAVVAAQNVTHAIDQEVAAVEFLLQGLATSPALQSGDLRAFRRQLVATPTPSGTWFVLMDDREHLINTRLAEGAKLPSAPGVLQRIRDRGYRISNRFAARSAPDDIVSVSMLVHDSAGHLKYILSYVLSEQRLSDLVKRARLSERWQTVVFDRDYNPIVDLRPQTAAVANARDPWADEIAGKVGSGIVRGAPVLLAYSRSAISGWTAATALPLAAARAPINTALAQILAGGAVLLGLGSLVAGLIARRLERPIETLRKSATRTKDQLRTTEGALQTTQARYRTYWDHTAECLFAVRVRDDGKFVIEGLNPAHERLSGLSSAGISGKTPHQCLPPEAADTVSGHYRDCVQAEKAITYEEVLSLPGGVRRWQTTLAPVRDPDTGRITLILGSARDITRDREATEQISRGRHLLERIAKASPEFIYVFDLRARKVDFISARVHDAVGYAPDEVRALKDRVLKVLVHPDDLPRVAAYLEGIKTLPDTGIATINARLAHKDQGYRWFTGRSMVFSRGADGEVSRVIGVAIDLTDLKATQDALAVTNDRLRSILASISDCYFTLDHDCVVTDINDAALRWLKLAPHEAIGRPCFEEFPSFPVQRSAMVRAAQDGKPLHLEVPSSIHPGRWLDFHIYPSPEGYSVFFRDISERRIAVQTLEKTKGLLDSTLNALSAYVVILDEKGTILLVNQAWRQFLSRSGRFIPDDGIGASYRSLNILPPAVRSNLRRFSAGLERVLSGAAADFRCTFQANIGDDERWYQIHAARFHSNGWSRIVVAHEDVTDVRLAQKALDDLSERLLHLQEEERQRIAIELHDSTCQHLVAVGTQSDEPAAPVSARRGRRAAARRHRRVARRSSQGAPRVQLSAASALPGEGRPQGHAHPLHRRLLPPHRPALGGRHRRCRRRPRDPAAAFDPAGHSGGARERQSSCRCPARGGHDRDRGRARHHHDRRRRERHWAGGA